MSKVGQVIVVVVFVSIVYLAMLVIMPIVSDFSISANATITASGANITAHPGSTSFLLSIPWILWFIPGSIGIAVVVVILKRP